MRPLVASVAVLTVNAVAIAPLTIAPFLISTTMMAATTFGQKEVEQSRFIVMAVPRGQTAYNLLIVEQLVPTSQRACWQVKNDAAQTVEPLLLNFNFTGICGRGTDSNAFSIRMAGEDLGLKYTLRLADRNGVVVLLATPSSRTLPELELGRTRANIRDYMKIDLDPGWRLTRRTFNGRDLSHVYFTNNTDLATIAAQLAQTPPSLPPSPVASPSPSPIASPSPSPSPSPIASPLPSPSPSPIVIVPVPIPSPSPRPSPSPIPMPVPSASPSPYTAQVQQLYREVLRREADAPGLAYHTRRMEQGRTLAQVRQDLQNSPEGRQIAGIPIPVPTPSVSPSPSPSPTVNLYVGQVQQLYREVLNREADAPGLAYHSRRMEQGRTLAQVQQDLQNSPEGRRIAITRIFQQEVGKLPEAAVVDRYSQRLGEEGWSFDRIRQDIRQNYVTVPVVATQPSPASTQITGRFPENAYFVVIPAARTELPTIARKVRQLGVAEVNIFQRENPRGSHVAVGPFMQRGLAEQWNTYLKKAGFDARVYYGN